MRRTMESVAAERSVFATVHLKAIVEVGFIKRLYHLLIKTQLKLRIGKISLVGEVGGKCKLLHP